METVITGVALGFGSHNQSEIMSLFSKVSSNCGVVTWYVFLRYATGLVLQTVGVLTSKNRIERAPLSVN